VPADDCFFGQFVFEIHDKWLTRLEHDALLFHWSVGFRKQMPVALKLPECGGRSQVWPEYPVPRLAGSGRFQEKRIHQALQPNPS